MYDNFPDAFHSHSFPVVGCSMNNFLEIVKFTWWNYFFKKLLAEINKEKKIL